MSSTRCFDLDDMSEEDGEQNTLQAIEWCTNLQCLIEISAKDLEGLRTQCLTRAVLTQQEIRRIEVGVYLESLLPFVMIVSVGDHL